MCSLRRTGYALSVILHFWHSSVLGRSAEVFHACRDLSGSKRLSCCSGQLRPVVWLLKFSNGVWMASVWLLVGLTAAVILWSERKVSGFSTCRKGGSHWFSCRCWKGSAWLSSRPRCPSGRDFFLPVHTLLPVRMVTYFCVCFNAPIETSCFVFSPSFPACCCHGFFRNLNREGVTSLFLLVYASKISSNRSHKESNCQRPWSLLGVESWKGCRYEFASFNSFTLHLPPPSVVLINPGSRWFTV